MDKSVCTYALLCSLLYALPASAEYVKCVDANGKVSYSDVGCSPGVTSSKIQLKENTVDSYGDQMRINKLEEIEEERAGIRHSEASPGKTPASSISTQSRQNSSVTPMFGYSSSYSSSAACTDYRCQLDRQQARRWSSDQGTRAATPSYRNSGSADQSASSSHDTHPPRRSEESSSASRKSRKWSRVEDD